MIASPTQRLLPLATVIVVTLCATAHAEPSGQSCRTDDQCGSGTYCEGGRCVRVRRHVNLLYLFYLSGDRRFSEVLGVYWQRRGPSGYRVLFPLYWDFRDDPERARTRVVLPFFIDHRNQREGTRNLIVPPFQYTESKRERSYRFWPLFFYSRSSPAEYSLTIPPFFYRSRRDQRRTTVFPILLSYHRSGPEPGHASGLLGGVIYWSRETDRRSWAVIPILYGSRSPGRHFGWLAPLNFFVHNSSHTTVTAIPIFFHRSTHFGLRSSSTFALAPPFFHRVNRERLDLHIFPVFFLARDRARRHTFLLSGPIYYRSAERRWSFALLPLLFAGRGVDRSHQVVFPIFWHLRAGASRSLVIGPGYYHRDGERSLATGLAPIFFYHRGRDANAAAPERTLLLLAPPYLHHRGASLEQDILPPLFARWRDRRADSTTWLFGGPIVHHADPSSSATVVFPLFWRFKDRRSGASTTLLLPLALRRRDARGGQANVLGPLFYRRRPAGEGWNAGLAPILFAGRHRGRSHQVLFPIFWHLRGAADPFRGEQGHDVFVLGPFFRARVAAANQVLGLIPLFLAGRWEGRPFFTLAPPLFLRTSNPAAGTSFTLAGLYLRARSSTQTVQMVLPLAFRVRSASAAGIQTATTLVPFFHYRSSPRDRLLVTPLGGHHRDFAYSRSLTLIGPILYRRSRESRTLALMPLLWHHARADRGRSTTVLAPLFVHDRSPRRRSTVLFPLAWSFRREDRRSLLLLPLCYRHRAPASGLAIDVWLPFISHVRHPEGRALVLGPAFYSRSRETRTLGLLPLAILRRSPRGTTLASPVFYFRHDREAGRRLLVLGPLYHHRDRDRRDLGLAPIFHLGRSALATHAVLFPAFWARWDREGGRRACLLPLACYLRDSAEPGARRALYTPAFGYSSASQRRTVYVGPVLHHRSPGTALSALLPAVVWHRDRRTAVSTLFALPALYLGRWSASERLHAVMPLFWHASTTGSFSVERRSATVLFPLFWDFARGDRRRTTLLLPLFLRQHDRDRESVSFLTPPALWVRPHPHGVDVALFPLLWHFAGKESRSLVAFPLLWHFRRGTSRSTVVFPVFWRFETPKRSTVVVLNTYYRRDKVQGTYDLNVLPVVRVQRKRPQDLRLDLLAGLFGFERVGRNRYLRLFFIPFELRPQPAGGLSSNDHSSRWEL